MTHFLITGHSRGLGAALAHQLLAEGHAVWGISRTPLTEPRPSTGHLHELCVDLSDANALEQLLKSHALTDFFAPNQQAVLINNAGLLAPIGLAGTLESEAIVRAVTVNTAAALALANTFIAVTSHVRDRRLVHISSGAARSPYAGWSVYCATKASLDHHVRCLAIEGHAGLRAESIAPGVIDTDMQRQVRSTSLDQFPMRGKFDALKSSGALASPASVASKLITHVLGAAFGEQSCTDLRQMQT